jgi:hypothetical protein
LHSPEIDYALDYISIHKTHIKQTMDSAPVEIVLDGAKIKTYEDAWLVDAISREKGLPSRICYHPRLGPTQSLRKNLKSSPTDATQRHLAQVQAEC